MNQNLESFTTALLKLPSTEPQKKATDSERKKLKRKHQRECHDMINEHMKEHDALHALAEGQSLSS